MAADSRPNLYGMVVLIGSILASKGIGFESRPFHIAYVAQRVLQRLYVAIERR